MKYVLFWLLFIPIVLANGLFALIFAVAVWLFFKWFPAGNLNLEYDIWWINH